MIKSPKCSWAVVATAGLLALALPARDSRAVYRCDGVTDDCICGDYNPYPCCNNGGGNYGNCTWWAWHRACCDWGVDLPGWGNANTWAHNAQANPSYDVLSSPVVGSIACADRGTWGHVAWVTAVNGSQITVTEMNCCSGCNNGWRTRTYSASWFNQGFIVRIGCGCSPGDTESRTCGDCGTQTRSCGNDCQWGAWGSCTGEGPCTQGQTESQACGDCGTRTRTCGNNCRWGAWGNCTGEGPCAQGQTESQGCGNCGTRTHTCGSNCQWGAWGGCTGEGPCAQGQIESQACGDCGTQTRSCGGGCQWEEWSRCAGPDPGGGRQVCDTGLQGVCAEGILRCLDGYLECEQTVFPMAEVIDISRPVLLRPQEKARAFFVFRNAGDWTWTAGEVVLGTVPAGSRSRLWTASWPAHDVAAVLGRDVSPGDMARLDFELGAGRECGVIEERLDLRDGSGQLLSCGSPEAWITLEVRGSALPEESDGHGANLEEEPDPDSVVIGGCGGCSHGSRPGGLWLLLAVIPVLILGLRRFCPGGVRGGRAVMGLQVMLVACLALHGCGQGSGELTIISVSPSTGSARGGEVVIIEGHGFGSGARVFFGDVEAGEIQVDPPALISVLTPARPAGNVDVVVEIPRGRRSVAEGAFEYLPIDVSYADYSSGFPAGVTDSRGVLLCDVDMDGDRDVVIAVRGGPNRLLVNDGLGNFREIAGLAERLEEETLLAEDSHAVAAGDLNGDLYMDLYVANGSDEEDRLYLNRGDGTFQDASDKLPDVATTSQAVALGDLDGDGDLDIIVAVAGTNRIMVNLLKETNELAFEEGSERLPDDQQDLSTGVALVDVDLDGDLDMVVANDQQEDPVRIYLNDGQGVFEEGPLGQLPHQAEPCLSVAAADLSGDGSADLLAMNRGQNRFYLNDGAGFFFDDTSRAMPWDRGASSSAVVFDADLDGDYDLAIAGYGVSNRLYLNRGDGVLRDYTVLLPEDECHSVGVVAGDLDGDGDADLIFTNDRAEHDLLYLLDRLSSQQRSLGGGLGGTHEATYSWSGGGGCSTAPTGSGAGASFWAMLVAVGLVFLRRKGGAILALAAAVGVACCSPFGPDSVCIEAIIPDRGSAAGGEEVRAVGSGFEDGLTLYFGDRLTEVLSIEGREILLRTPTAVAGSVDVVISPASGQAATLYEGFTYEPLDAAFADHSALLPEADAVRGRSAVAVDLNGDGAMDLIQAVGEGSLRVMINWFGYFIDETANWMPVSEDPVGDTWALAAGDVNGDGLVDLAVANCGPAGQRNRLFLGGEDEPFFDDVTEAALPVRAACSTDVALTDVDGDEDLDLIFADWKDGELSEDGKGVILHLNDGSGVFGPGLELLPDASAAVWGLALGDFDADADLDVFAAVDGGDCRLLLNDGAGGFTLSPPPWVPVLEVACRSPAVGDVNGDGHADIYLSNAAGQDRLLLNDGTGRFQDFTSELLPVDPGHTEQAVLADLDLDGDLDLLLARHEGAQGHLYLNDGAGRMYDYSYRLPGGVPEIDNAFVTADLNGNGAPDIFLSVDGGSGRLFLQNPAPVVE